jgi:hypothetical protein
VSLVDDIQAVRAREDLTRDEKRAMIYDLKGEAIVAQFLPHVGNTLTRGIYTMRLDRLPVFHPNRTLEFWITVTKDGVEQPLDLPIYLVNPPILVPDGLGGYTLNVLQACRDALIDVVR